MPDFIDRLGTELARAATAEPLQAGVDSGKRRRSIGAVRRQLPSLAPQPADAKFRKGGLRRLGTLARVSVVIVGLLGCSGLAVAARVLLAGSQAQKLPTFDCQISASVTTGVPALTGNPIVDCATEWPSATGGQENAPPLAIWGINTNQQLSAIVRPLSLGSPGANWRRLPDDWTVDLPIVELEDQLANISLPFSDQGPSTECSVGSESVSAVRSLLHDDGLDSWNVALQATGGGQPTSGCTSFANVEGAKQTVELMQTPTNTSASTSTSTTTTPAVTATTTTQASPGMTAENEAVAKLKQLYTNANATLTASCESVAAATALWAKLATAEGFQPTTLAFDHAINTSQPDPATYPYHYTLYQQPDSQNTGTCAHVLVMMVPGSGLANVYVARIAP